MKIRAHLVALTAGITIAAFATTLPLFAKTAQNIEHLPSFKMAGAIIMRNDRIPGFVPDGRVKSPGGIDRLMVDADGSAIPDYVLVLQQIRYACRYSAGPKKDESQKTWSRF